MADSAFVAPRSRSRPGGFRAFAVRLHRKLGILAAAFWLVQAVTGIFILFHWELEDASVSLVSRPTDLDAIEARLDALAPPGSGRRVVSVWTTAGLADRYEVTVAETDGRSTGVRIAGDGSVLRVKDKSERNFIGSLVLVHQKLLLGDFGSWIVGISGILLITNILLGLRAAWPRRGQWRAALLPPRRGPRAARVQALHRALGLAAALPVLLFVGAGTCLVFQDGLSRLVAAESPSLPAVAPTGRPDIGFARAARAAIAALDARNVTAMNMPVDDDATYRIRVLAPDEIRRAFGTSVVFVHAETGAVRAVFPAADAPAGRAFIDGLYAVHTGEALGLAGRLLQLATAVWVATMTVLGIMLWRARRRPGRVRDGKAAAVREALR